MRLVVLAALLLGLARPLGAQVISCGWRRERTAPDLVVRGTAIGEQRRRVRARNVDFEVVRATLEVEAVLWGDADRPTPRHLDLHSARRVDCGPPPVWRGSSGVWSLYRAEVPNVYTVEEVASRFEHPRLEPRSRLVDGRLTGAEASIELRLENPGPTPVTFPLPGEDGSSLGLLVASLEAEEGYVTSVLEVVPPIVVPAGAYRTRSLHVRHENLVGRHGVRVRVDMRCEGLRLDASYTKGRWPPEVLRLRDSAPPEVESADLEGGWFSGLRWVGGPSWLDPDDPALRPQPTRPLRPRDGLAPAIAVFGALLWTFRRRKSLPGGEGGR